jgi:hypothetical protein
MVKQAKWVLGTTVALVLAGCGITPGTLPGSTGPGAGTAPAQISGHITHLGGAPGQALTLSLKRYDGANYQRIGVSTKTDNQGNYSFSNLSPGRYQVFYDDQGQVVQDADVNTVGAYVDAAVQVVDVSAGGTGTDNFDIGWSFTPTIRPNATYHLNSADSFSFSTKFGAQDSEYQILVADGNKSAVWSSGWTQGTSFTWNGNRGSETDQPTGAYTGSGLHYYQVKFRKLGTDFGGDGYYGQTKWVPFQLVR